MTLHGLTDRSEYLGKEEMRAILLKGAPRSPSACASAWLLTDDRGDFSFDGHRLSSLYRTTRHAALTLMDRYFSASSLIKYSPGARGWKTPASVFPLGKASL